jgi:imidazolonepropionase-like amidohydrolase
MNVEETMLDKLATRCKRLQTILPLSLPICLVLAGTCAAAPPSSARAPVLAIVGATVYPSPDGAPVRDAVVLVRDKAIWRVGTRGNVKVPAGATRIDGHGMVMTAGYWNSHVHFMEPQWQDPDALPAAQLTQQLQDMLTRYGFTRAFDTAALDIQPLLRLRARIDSGDVLGPRIYTVGVPMTPASPFYIEPLQLPVVRSSDEAAAHVRRQAANGADGIKLWSASPTGKAIVPMDVALIQAGVAAAHERRLPVFAHPTDLDGVARAVDGGVDVLAHVAAENRVDWPAPLLANMLAHRVALIPTLKLHEWDLERTGHPSANDPLLRTAVQQVKSYADAGGTILFGTDVGFMTDYAPDAEYALMAQAGLSWRRILATLTTAPAGKFAPGQQVGTIAPGQAADLVLLSADPAVDARNFAKVAYTIREGRLIYQARQAAKP